MCFMLGRSMNERTRVGGLGRYRILRRQHSGQHCNGDQ